MGGPGHKMNLLGSCKSLIISELDTSGEIYYKEVWKFH